MRCCEIRGVTCFLQDVGRRVAIRYMMDLGHEVVGSVDMEHRSFDKADEAFLGLSCD